MRWQRLGIDRWGVRNDFIIPVEYKADFRAGQTGNMFLETTKNLNSNKPGWAKTTMAQVLYYYVPPTGKIYELNPLAWKLGGLLLDQFPKAKAYNEGYAAEGVLVPLTYLSEHLNSLVILEGPIFTTEQQLFEKCEKTISEPESA